MSGKEAEESAQWQNSLNLMEKEGKIHKVELRVQKAGLQSLNRCGP